MSLVTLSFILFSFLTAAVYFAVGGKRQWIVLLVSSCVFYLTFGPKYILCVLATSLVTFLAANRIDALFTRQKEAISANKELSRDDKKKIKASFAKKRKGVLTAALIINFGMLAFFKYSVFASQQISGLLKLLHIADVPVIESIAAPIGISFFTFQTAGYLADVYWKNVKAEKNYAKTLLFTSFFPQIIQGPISRFDQLSAELFTEHKFDYKNFSYGCQRMIWGFMKKMVVADRLSLYVNFAFEHYNEYNGIKILICAFLYSIQIYADFSGYMDIVCGLCEILGIRLAENFERPYFSKSVAEYWRRWHITLGTWFKDYLYYPIALSHFAQNAGKKSKKLFGAHIGKNMPAVISLVVVWLTTGLWHGATWEYIAWGGLNGFFIIFSMLAEPLYKKLKTFFRIKENSFGFRAFQTLRSFLLITLIKVFPEVGTFRDGAGFISGIVRNLYVPKTLSDVIPKMMSLNDHICLPICITAMFVVSLLQRKRPVRDILAEKNIIFRWAVYICLLFMILLFGVSSGISGGFMYAQF